MKRFFLQTFQDKLGRVSGREITVFVFVLAALASWMGDQFFGFPVNEHVFYGMLFIIAAGLGFYTFEKPLLRNSGFPQPPQMPEPPISPNFPNEQTK